jgi:hypothetical protein
MWKFEKACVEGDCNLFGINLFDYKWVSTGKKVTVVEPSCNKPYDMNVYTVCVGVDTVMFATREITASIYGFALWHDEE